MNAARRWRFTCSRCEAVDEFIASTRQEEHEHAEAWIKDHGIGATFNEPRGQELPLSVEDLVARDVPCRGSDECPAGGEHRWVEWNASDDGPGLTGSGLRCDECGATPASADYCDYCGWVEPDRHIFSCPTQGHADRFHGTQDDFRGQP